MPWNALTNIRGPQGVQGEAGNRAAVTRAVAYAASLTVTADSALAVDRVNVTATGGLALTPGGGADGQVLRINVLASAAQRTITIATSVRTGSGLTRSFNVPSGQILMLAFEYSSLINAWVLTAATVSAT